ncbi:hypothetical protein SAMN05216302_10135 [Nitrosomonas aestuarii]|uniref:Uncharacterized protein n=1 Tax=Nitrosomonas aestuarii TaxID=52441 RepID=A0A1I4BQ25_9PROT|nr:hypothetical protein [Nitrosomonas aestuarii]SFK70643.1 hypothetical protein SAMN05216302_10135 [Nitrosomonas aestuarii]
MTSTKSNEDAVVIASHPFEGLVNGTAGIHVLLNRTTMAKQQNT